MFLIKEDLTDWSINTGIPAKKIKNRNKNPKQLATKIKNNERT